MGGGGTERTRYTKRSPVVDREKGIKRGRVFAQTRDEREGGEIEI